MRSRTVRLLVALLVVGAAACAGKSERQEDGGEAGEGASTSTGGASPSSGGSNGARGGTAATRGGSSSGGSSAATAGTSSGTSSGGSSSGGSSGTSSGGASGSSGSSGSNTCPTCTPSACSTLPIPTRTINDFENLLYADGSNGPVGIYGVLDEQGMPKPEWWLGYFSGYYVYPFIPELCSGQPPPTYPLTATDANGELRVTGTVGGYSSFGIWLGQCIVDMSDYGGISFRMSGNWGPGPILLRVFTNSNVEPDTCLEGKGSCDVATVGACVASAVAFSPSATGVAEIPWSSFVGGLPEFGVDPSEVVQFSWDFYWTESMTPYEVDVIIDDVVLFD